MIIKYCIADDDGCIVLPRKIKEQFDLADESTVYLTILSDLIIVNPEAYDYGVEPYSCIYYDTGKISLPVMNPNEPYKIEYNPSVNIIVCRLSF